MNSLAPTRAFLSSRQCPITSSYTTHDQSNLLAITEVTLLKRQLVLELLLLLGAVRAPSAHLLAYLAEAEACELDLWLRDDIHIAWLTVWFANQDYLHPWDYAFEHYLGRHPARLIPELLARTAEREKLLGPGIAASLQAAEGQPSSPLSPQAAPFSKFEKEMPCTITPAPTVATSGLTTMTTIAKTGSSIDVMTAQPSVKTTKSSLRKPPAGRKKAA